MIVDSNEKKKSPFCELTDIFCMYVLYEYFVLNPKLQPSTCKTVLAAFYTYLCLLTSNATSMLCSCGSRNAYLCESANTALVPLLILLPLFPPFYFFLQNHT